MEELPKAYEPGQVEQKWYQYWVDNGYFHTEVDRSRKPFCITIPPPNITGSLHMGHALCYTLQDILVRWRRMQGYNTLCLPGTDHAGIATQNVVEKKLAKQGLTRHDLGREKFLEQVWDWKEEYGNTIIRQFKTMGYSFDWDRLRFTLDEGYVDAVLEEFVRLYHEGYIYRGARVTNWCPRCRTAISDIEVEHEDQPAHLYHISYPFADGEGSITVATTRPETLLGDTAVAVNPQDERYIGAHGRMLTLPLVGRTIPVVADEYVDPAFGTGAVKVTPAHDPNDFEIGMRHRLPQIVVIGQDATMTEEAGKYKGMDRFACRKQVVEDLREQGFLVKIDDYSHSVGHCERCGTVLEPLLSEQWFVRMKELAQPAIEAVKQGRIRFIPDRYARVYLDWMENIRDWCISRQLWWGHRIPVWTCPEGHYTVAKSEPEACAECGSKELTRDPDVLDTWFSSALWPHATLGWPKQTPELDYFYPTNVLVTAREILYLWVARMITTGLKFVDEIPFHDVYIYATVLNWEGKRMSKSLGTGINPLDLTSQYGTDATRFAITLQAGKTQDMRFDDGRRKPGDPMRAPLAETSRNFANKIWNAARFALMHIEEGAEGIGVDSPLPEVKELADRWILSRLNRTIEIVNNAFEEYNFDEANKALYSFLWNEFCDWYVELAKPRLRTEDQTVRAILVHVLDQSLRLLHPVMPFITEEIWQKLPGASGSIMVAFFPEVTPSQLDETAESQMEQVMQVIAALRNMRAEMNVPSSKAIPTAIIGTADAAKLEAAADYIRSLARVEAIQFEAPEALHKYRQSLSANVEGIQLLVPLAGLVDIEVEVRRVTNELESVEKDIQRVNAKLSNEQYLAKAPAAVVEKDRQRQQELQNRHRALRQRLELLRG
ncbi:MAG TPA: valine--tRNA ligase [Armatimonadota bacterium]|nr:valine--tRNA ligase [Armatimonadota bacterium]